MGTLQPQLKQRNESRGSGWIWETLPRQRWDDGHREHLNGYPRCVAKVGVLIAGTGSQEEANLKASPGAAVRRW